MNNYCVYCRKQLITKPHRFHCSARCRDSDRYSRRSDARKDARYQILTTGYDRADEVMFEEAERLMRAADDRALRYRLALDLVDDQPSRAPFDPGTTDRRCRTILFPEPNRRNHLDTKGLRRPGDFFSLRHPFERPAVPIAAYYRVQLLGLHVLGEPIILTPPRDDGTDLYVELPPSPFVGRWKSRDWGSKELPAHRQRQIAKRACDREREKNAHRESDAIGSEPLDLESTEET